MEQNYITVTLLNTFIKNSLDSEQLLDGVTVFGEVVGAKMSGAHLYFTLKDDSATISCNSFNAVRTYIPKDGESVLVTGKVDYYVKAGRLNFIATKIQNVGAGLLALKFEELKRKLFAEGLFSDSYKKPIPDFCATVGVLTSKSGAVIRDIITTTRRYNKNIDLSVIDTRVQGIDAVNDLVTNLEIMDKLGFDVIIIARGGGSLADLEPFNSEKLARAIFKTRTPIISAVGHETDVTICDMVADVRSATPTAAAELIAYSEEDLLNNFRQSANIMQAKLTKLLDERKNKLSDAATFIKNRMFLMLSDSNATLKVSAATLKNNVNNLLTRAQTTLEKLVLDIGAKNPMTLFDKGLFKIKKDGKYITPSDSINIGDDLEIISKENNILATVNGFRETKQ